jgi:hypothetical protein
MDAVIVRRNSTAHAHTPLSLVRSSGHIDLQVATLASVPAKLALSWFRNEQARLRGGPD